MPSKRHRDDPDDPGQVEAFSIRPYELTNRPFSRTSAQRRDSHTLVQRHDGGDSLSELAQRLGSLTMGEPKAADQEPAHVNVQRPGLGESRELVNRVLKLDKQGASAYQLLGVGDSEDDNTVIKKAWKDLTWSYHPDRNSDEDSAQCFDLLKRAYENIKNSSTRARYAKFRTDQLLEMYKAGASAYELLRLEDFEKDDEIIKEAWNRESRPYLRKNDSESKQCLRILQDAYEIIENPGLRATYDNELLLNKQSRTYEEEFAENALEDESDVDSAKPQHQRQYGEPSPPGRNIEQPSDHVRMLREGVREDVLALIFAKSKERQNAAKVHIKAVNDRIKHENQRAGSRPDNYSIDPEDLAPSEKDVEMVERYLKEKNWPLANLLGQAALVNFEQFCSKPNSQWPKPWAEKFKELLGEIFRKYGQEFGVKDADGRAKAAAVRRSRRHMQSPDVDGDIKMNDDSSSAFWDQRSSKSRKRNGISIDQLLGHRTYFNTEVIRDGIRQPRAVQFLVGVNDRNPIKLMPGARVGAKLKQQYFQLPPAQQNAISRSEAPVNISDEDSVKIIGYACYTHKDKGRIPDGVASVLVNGEEYHFSLSALRKELGEEADELILEFFRDHRLPLPFTPLLEGRKDSRGRIRAAKKMTQDLGRGYRLEQAPRHRLGDYDSEDFNDAGSVLRQIRRRDMQAKAAKMMSQDLELAYGLKRAPMHRSDDFNSEYSSDGSSVLEPAYDLKRAPRHWSGAFDGEDSSDRSFGRRKMRNYRGDGKKNRAAITRHRYS